MMLGVGPGGVSAPAERARLKVILHQSWSRGVTPHISASRSVSPARDGIPVEKGCVGDTRSLDAAPSMGTRRSSTLVTGTPVARSSTKISPRFVGCATAGPGHEDVGIRSGAHKSEL